LHLCSLPSLESKIFTIAILAFAADQDAPTLFEKVNSKLLETKICCYKTNQKKPDLTAMYAANLAKLNIWNDVLESITDMKEWDKFLDQPTIFGTKLTERERKQIQTFLKFSVLYDNC
jgi:hypothetical protein